MYDDKCKNCFYCDHAALEILNPWCTYPESIGTHISDDLQSCGKYREISREAAMVRMIGAAIGR